MCGELSSWKVLRYYGSLRLVPSIVFVVHRACIIPVHHVQPWLLSLPLSMLPKLMSRLNVSS